MLTKYSFPLLIFCSVFALACIHWGSNGVRGTDQYWYLADVDTLIESGQPVSNIYYPGNILRDTYTPDKPNFFMHNGPMLYITALLGNFFGAYNAWILINTLSHLLVAVCIYTISKSYTSPAVATTVTCAYLLSPIAIWQTLNLLQEQFFAGLMAAAFLCYHFRKFKLSWAISILVGALGTFSHPIFFLLCVCCTVLVFAQGIYFKQHIQAIVGVLLTVAVVVLKAIGPQLFPSTFQPDLPSIIASSAPGQSNMLYHYSDQLPAINTQLFIDKLKDAITRHLFDLKNSPFYLYTNLALIGSLLLVVSKKAKPWDIVLPVWLALGLYGGIILLMQTQMRYQQIVAPATFILIAVVLKRYFNEKGLSLLLLPLLACSVLITAYLSFTVNQQANTQAQDADKISEIIDRMDRDVRLISYNNGIEVDLRMSYLTNPRALLVLKSKYLTKESEETVLSQFKPNYLVVTDVESALDFPTSGTPTLANTDSLGELYFFELKN